MDRNTYNPAGGKLYDSNGNVVYFSDLFNSIIAAVESNAITEDTEISVYQKRHREIHNGNFYTVSEIFTVPASDSIDFGFITSSERIHLTPPVIKTSKEDVEFYGYSESVYTGGTPITIQNNDLGSSNTSGLTIKSGVTISPGGRGTKRYTDFIPGSTGIGGRSNGGSNAEVEEFILEPNTIYSFEVVNNSGDANKCFVLMQWYGSDD